MKTQYLPSFLRDLKAIRKVPIYAKIRSLAFEEVPGIDNLSQVQNVKKIKGNDSAYRIRVGDYRIGIFVEPDGTITFARVRHRRDIYNYFP